MFIELIIAITAGILFGIITGLTPGIHVNLIALLAVSAAPFLINYISVIAIAVFIISLAVTHSFLDSIPSIYLGAPDEAHALSALPGHRMLIEGEGHIAVACTMIGSFAAMLSCILLVPLFILLVYFLQPLIKPYIGYILIIIMSYMILKDKKRKYNFVIFTLSSILGLIVLNMPNSENYLLPLLSGLFGFSILIKSLLENSSIPEQKSLHNNIDIKKSTLTKATTGATIMGFIASFLPGFGNSQAAIIATQFLRNLGDKGFLILTGGINTANFSLSLITLYILSKARNGAVLSITKLIPEVNFPLILTFFTVVLISGCISMVLGLKISKLFCKLVAKVNYKALIIGVLSFTAILVFVFGQFTGILILIIATAIGLLAGEFGVGKNHCMGCLILPVILYFI